MSVGRIRFSKRRGCGWRQRGEPVRSLSRRPAGIDRARGFADYPREERRGDETDEKKNAPQEDIKVAQVVLPDAVAGPGAVMVEF